MAKKEIKFNKSMGADKRNENFAYLRKQVANSNTAGLYPMQNLNYKRTVQEDRVILGIVSDSTDRYLLTEGTSDTLKVMEIENGDLTINNLSNQVVEAIVKVATPSNDWIYYVNSYNNRVRSVKPGSGVSDNGNFNSNPDVSNGCFDGLYVWWVGEKIWRQLPDEDPELMMTSTGFETVHHVIPYQNRLAIFHTNENDFDRLTITFYDKANTTFFEKRVEMRGCNVLGAGVLDERLIMVHYEGINGITGEEAGNVIVSVFNGERFEKINSFPVYGFVSAPRNTLKGMNSDYNNECLVVTIRRSSEGPLERSTNGIYKIFSDGRIEMMYSPYDLGATQFYFVSISEFGGISAITDKNNVYIQDKGVVSMKNYENFTNTEYITGFYNNPGDRYKLTAFNVTFEKMFANINAQPPIVIQKGLYFSGKLDTSTTINWYTATDAITPEEELEYDVYISSINNIGTLAEIDLNGELKGTTKEQSLEVTGLDPQTTYWANVVVRDSGGKRTPYTQNTFTTDELGVIASDWKLAGSNGTILGVTAWDSAARLRSLSDNYAFSENPSKETILYNFGHSIPAGATIKGIDVRMKGYISATAGFPKWIIGQVLKNGSTGTPTYTPENFNLWDNNLIAVNLFNKEPVPQIIQMQALWGASWTDSDIADIGVSVSGSTTRLDPREEANYFLSYVEMRIIYKP